jgi:hypothetical protein
MAQPHSQRFFATIDHFLVSHNFQIYFNVTLLLTTTTNTTLSGSLYYYNILSYTFASYIHRLLCLLYSFMVLVATNKRLHVTMGDSKYGLVLPNG